MEELERQLFQACEKGKVENYLPTTLKLTSTGKILVVKHLFTLLVGEDMRK